MDAAWCVCSGVCWKTLLYEQVLTVELLELGEGDIFVHILLGLFKYLFPFLYFISFLFLLANTHLEETNMNV